MGATWVLPAPRVSAQGFPIENAPRARVRRQDSLITSFEPSPTSWQLALALYLPRTKLRHLIAFFPTDLNRNEASALPRLCVCLTGAAVTSVLVLMTRRDFDGMFRAWENNDKNQRHQLKTKKDKAACVHAEPRLVGQPKGQLAGVPQLFFVFNFSFTLL